MDSIGVLLLSRNATGVEHVLVGDGAEGGLGFLSSEGFVGEGAGGDEASIEGRGAEEGGGAEDPEGFVGGGSFGEGAVVGEVEEVGDVDDYGVSYLGWGRGGVRE